MIAVCWPHLHITVALNDAENAETTNDAGVMMNAFGRHHYHCYYLRIFCASSHHVFCIFLHHCYLLYIPEVTPTMTTNIV